MPDDKEKDFNLIEKVARGDSDSFSSLYDQFHISVFNYILRLVHQTEVAEELLQETFLGVWQSAKRFRKKSSVKTWIFRIAHNKVVSWLRKQGRLQTSLLENITSSSQARYDNLPEEISIQNWEHDQVRAALNKLTPSHRAVIELTFVNGFAYSEIAEILNCPVGTVKSRMSYGLKYLQQELRSLGLSG